MAAKDCIPPIRRKSCVAVVDTASKDDFVMSSWRALLSILERRRE